MSNLENLKECLNQLSLQNPQLVQSILKHINKGTLEEFALKTTERGEFNLFFNKKHRPFYLHDPSGAAVEANAWFMNLNPRRQVLYQFGVGLGYTFVYLKKWLEAEKNHHLVFLEAHLPVFFHLFQTEIGRKIVEHPRVHLYHFSNRKNLDSLVEYLATYFSLLRPSYSALPSYERAYPNLSAYMADKLPERQEMISTRLIESRSASRQAFTNFIQKFPNLSGNYNGSKMTDLFRNIPCIICGAGPSLKKNIDLLKGLKDKALILAGSSAVPALSHAGITPHFGNFFDPYPRVHQRFMNTTAFEMPTFHCARTYYETSRWIHGPKLYTKGSDDIPFVDWIENELGFCGGLVREYISVTAYNTSIALRLGCNPIIYVGVDLAFTENNQYMEGAHNQTSYKMQDKEKVEDGLEYNEETWSKDIEGNPIRTRFGWEVESRFLGDIVAPFRAQREIINATEGGIGIVNVPNLTLKEVSDRFLLQSYPLDELIHLNLSTLRVQDPKILKKCMGLFREFKESFDRVEKLYQGVIKDVKNLRAQNLRQELEEIDESFLFEAETQISEEIAYQYYLIHHHQAVDIENIKTKTLYKELSSDAPKTLHHEIKLSRIFNRFSSYLGHSKVYKQILSDYLKERVSEPWE